MQWEDNHAIQMEQLSSIMWLKFCYRSYYLKVDYIFITNVYICHKHLKIHEEIKFVLGLVYFHPKTQIFSRFPITSNL
jgi:hypothetical protein